MKVPPQAKRVFKGEIFDVYQWEQELFDGSKATFEMVKRPGTVQIIPVVGDKVLLSHEEQPHYERRLGLFGGRIEAGEEPLEAAKRELREETGMESDDWVLIKKFQAMGKIDWSVSYFAARNCQRVCKPHLDPGERIEIKEISFDDFIKTLFQEDFPDRQLTEELALRQADPKRLKDFRALLY